MLLLDSLYQNNINHVLLLIVLSLLSTGCICLTFKLFFSNELVIIIMMIATSRRESKYHTCTCTCDHMIR